MKNKFIFLTKDSLKSKTGTKAFKIVNVFLCILLVALINLDSLIKLFGGDFNELINIYVIDEAEIYDDIETVMNDSMFGMLDSYNAKMIESDKTLDELQKEIKEEESDHIIIHITKSENESIKEIFNAKIISYGYIDTMLYQSITTALNTTKASLALNKVDIDQQMLADINAPVAIERILLDETLDEDEEMLELIASIILLVFILPIFMLIITVVQMIGAEINEEKSSKGMEIIISSVSPRMHFLSKLVAANLFAIIQGLLIFAYGIIGCIIKFLVTGSVNLNGTLEGILGSAGATGSGASMVSKLMQSGIIDKLISGIPVILLLIILTFVAYTLFIGILASVTTSMEDFNQIQTPVMIFLMAGYMLSIYASLFKGSVLLRIMSFIPFISGILSPVMYMLGEVTLLEMFASIVLLTGTIFILYKYGLRVYKVGILNYSSSNLWKKIFKALKTKD